MIDKIAVYCLSALSMLFWLLQATYSGIIFVTFQVRGKRKISKKILEYFKSAPEVLLELTVFALVFVFCVVSIYNTATDKFFSKALWRVGIFAVIFGWTSFVILSSKFPALGEYTLIFVSILKTFLKLAIFGFVLVMASTIVLRMLFYNPLELVRLLIVTCYTLCGMFIPSEFSILHFWWEYCKVNHHDNWRNRFPRHIWFLL